MWARNVSLIPIRSGIVTNVNDVMDSFDSTRRTWRTRRRKRSISSFIASLSFRPNNIERKPPDTRIIRMILSDHDSMSSGSERNLRVWPVGAVSKTITSHVGSSTCRSNSSKARASSRPGMTISDALTSSRIESISSLALGSSIMLNPPKPPRPPLPFMLFIISPNFGKAEEILDSGSISKPKSPGTPSTGVGFESNLTSRESEVECAGSLDTRSTRRPASANHTAVAAEVVVLPTPPLPPNKSSRAMRWATHRGL